MAGYIVQAADEIPLLVYWLLKMRVHEIIDRVMPQPHASRQGLSYGQLAVLFVAYVVHGCTHRLCEMEEWVQHHCIVLEQATGWSIGPKDATDDRLGDLLSGLGDNEERGVRLQRELGQHLIQAYALPTEVGRYDTTTFTVYHAPGEDGKAAGGVLSRGHSKDHRPDLLQFKQGLATLDPAGIPIFTNTVGGQAADDPLYLPAWREMKATIGHSHFLYVADCKAAAVLTRAQIDAEGGVYLFPLPMTGQVPNQLREWVLKPPIPPEPIVLSDVVDSAGQPKVVGCGFVVEQFMTTTLEDGQTPHSWKERWLVTRSDALAERRKASVLKRLGKAETELEQLNHKGFTSAAELESAAQRILNKREVSHLIIVQVSETVSQQTRYIGRGRPGPQRPQEVVDLHQAQLRLSRNDMALAEELQLAGWRIHVTNAPAQAMTLNQATDYYRDEFLVEHGFHRFKRGSLPVLPLWVRLPERIRGLMLLLLIALQLLTLIEFVVRQELAQRQETLAGLVPGNPKMKTARPSAERLLARFSGLNFVGEMTDTIITGKINENLTSVQQRILDLMGVPETIYTVNFSLPIRAHIDSS
jgi:transposase